VVEQAARDAGAFGDVVDPDVVVGARGEEFAGDGDELRAACRDVEPLSRVVRHQFNRLA
jgi:hypothetical protein